MALCCGCNYPKCTIPSMAQPPVLLGKRCQPCMIKKTAQERALELEQKALEQEQRADRLAAYLRTLG